MTEPQPEVKIPPAYTLAWTVVQALRALGGSGTIAEIDAKAIDLAGLTEEQQAVPHKRGSKSEIEYRLAWARTMIKAVGVATIGGMNVDDTNGEPTWKDIYVWQ